MLRRKESYSESDAYHPSGEASAYISRRKNVVSGLEVLILGRRSPRYGLSTGTKTGKNRAKREGAFDGKQVSFYLFQNH